MHTLIKSDNSCKVCWTTPSTPLHRRPLVSSAHVKSSAIYSHKIESINWPVFCPCILGMVEAQIINIKNYYVGGELIREKSTRKFSNRKINALQILKHRLWAAFSGVNSVRTILMSYFFVSWMTCILSPVTHNLRYTSKWPEGIFCFVLCYFV